MKRKITAWLLTIAMLVTMMPTSIWQASALEAKDAGNDPNGAQIGLHYDVSQENGTFSGNPTLSGDTYESNTKGDNDNIGQNDDDWRVWVDKTIAKQNPEKENEFDITLTVKTRSKIVAPQKDTSVVLVLDLSSSMVKNNIDKDTTRLKAAQEAANDFVTYYSGIAQGKRNLAIVGFNETSWAVMDWKTLGTDITTDSVKGIINGLKTKTGTNLEAGLLSAYSLLKSAPDGEKMVVLLSDGEPTCYVPNNEKNAEKYTYSNAASMGYGWPTNADRHNSHVGVVNAASKITGTGTNQLGVEMRTVFCGSNNNNLGGNGSCDLCNKSTVTLLNQITGADKVYTTYNIAALKTAFNDIVQQIELLTQAWQSTDPMGENTDWKGMVTENSNGIVEGVVATSDKLNWDLTETKPDEEIIDGKKAYVYDIVYKVKLDTLADKFDFNKWYATNGATELKYFFEEENEVKSIWFNVPTVQGYKGGYYKLIKVDENGNGLGGAEFTLEHNCGGDCTATWSKVYVSDSRGYVEMVNIPSGHEYILSETSAPEGYVGSNETHKLEVRYGEVYIDGELNKPLTIVNEKAVINIPVTKVWVDNDNQDGKRPETIKINLLADGDKVREAILSEDLFGNWKHTFDNLPRFKDGEKIVYTVQEEDVNGYTKTISTNDKNDEFTVTNTHTPEKTTVAGTKTWNDANNQDGIRPASITVKLLADGEEVEGKTLTVTGEGNEWSYEFKELPKYKEGKAIVYTVEEVAVEGYTTITNGFNFTNTHTPETIAVEGSKTWVDNDNQDGIRPDSIEVNLLADGTVVDTKTVTEEDDWAWNFTNLPKYAAGKVKQEITYSITETPVEGYETVVNGYDITNTHKIETVDIEGSKTWNDANNQDGKRPEEITVNLLADGKEVSEQTVTAEMGWKWNFTDLPKNKDGGVEIEYTVTEDAVTGYTTTINGYNITNIHTPETIKVEGAKTWNDSNNQDGKRPEKITVNLLADGEVVDTKTVTAEDNWAWSFEGLAKFKGGKEIVYTVSEEAVAEYVTTYNGYDVINKYDPKKTSITVNKVWNDNNDQDGIRADVIEVVLFANEEETQQKLTLNKANNWTGTFANLNKYANGKEISYSVKEAAVAGYESSVAVVGNVFTITNTHKPAELSIPVSKTWNDNDNQDGKRPDEITIKLYINDKATDKVVKLNAGNNWTGAFENLPKYNAGNEIVYTVKEVAVPGYTSEMTGSVENGFKFTNTRNVEKTSVNVAKVWDDADDQDGLRPDSIEVELCADGKETGMVLELDASNNWTGKFEDLNKNSKGRAIVYTVKELKAPAGYTVDVTGTQDTGYTITNSYTPAVVAVSGSKVWKDEGNQDGIRPTNITVKLLADGKECAEQTVTGDSKTPWEYVFENLPKYNKGVEIKYTVDEVAVDGYTTNINGTTITNTHQVAKTSVSGTKTWNDANNQDGKRPEAIQINLLANGQKVAEKTVTEADGWAWTFKDLDKYADGKEIEYTYSEIVIEDYSVKYEGTNVINAYVPEKTSVTVSKTWNDENNRDGIRPDDVTVVLYADGEATNKTLKLNAKNNWISSFEELDKYKAGGVEIAYTVKEVAVSGYEAIITGDASTGYNIENVHEIDTTSVSGSKTWIDADNQDGKRPEAITVNLLADGEEIDQAVVGEAEGWAWTFDNLPKYEDGKAIEYTVTEDKVEGYVTEINGYDITNTYECETREITITKRWMDESKRERPDSIKVNILANGEVYRTVELTAADNWELTVSDLPMYTDGEVGVKVVYSIEEELVEGYVPTIEGFDILNSKVNPADDSEQDKDKDKDNEDNGDAQGSENGKDNNGSDSAKTGDNMNLMALATAAIAALAAALAAIFRRKKNA